MPALLVGHQSARGRRHRRLLPEDKGAELTQKPVVVALGHRTGPAAQLYVDGFADKLLDDAPSHIDVTAVLDELAFEHTLQLSVASRLGQPLHPAYFEDFGAEVQCRDADRMRVGGEIAQRKNIIG